LITKQQIAGAVIDGMELFSARDGEPESALIARAG